MLTIAMPRIRPEVARFGVGHRSTPVRDPDDQGLNRSKQGDDATVRFTGQKGQPGQRRAARIVMVLLSSGALLVPAAIAHSDTPPPNPTDQQLQDAAAQKAALAAQVGQLSAQLAQAQAQLEQLKAAAEAAGQLLALKIQEYQDAQDAAALAKAAVASAQNDVVKAQTAFSNFVGESYMSGPAGGITAGLLVATDPNQLLQRSDLLDYTAKSQLSAITTLQRATITKANADAASRGAENAANQAQIAAQQAQQAAVAAAKNAQQQSDQLTATVASTQTQLDAAQQQLADLNNQRAAYDAYAIGKTAAAAAAAVSAAQGYSGGNAASFLAAAASYAAQAQSAATPAAAASFAAQANQAIASAKAESVAAAARLAANASRQSGSSSSSAVSSAAAPVPSGGSWSAAAGQNAVNRAMQWLGYPYAWAGGNSRGPTRGIAVDYDSRNDGNVVGFDCSGLTLYGWAPYISMPHYAASQYSVAGSYHPSAGQFQPGDLLFWSTGGVSGIHHVAMYIGNGNVIQAPESGDVIRITPWNQVQSGYFGATRPLT